LSPRHARWHEFLSQFTFKISFVPGSANVVADALSRQPSKNESTQSMAQDVLFPDSVWVDATQIRVPQRESFTVTDEPEHIAFFLELI
jgi:hypothetical protein